MSELPLEHRAARGLPGRISIIGATGAGKTCLARALAAERPAPLIHTDSFIWDRHWTFRRKAGAELRRLLKREDRWIADGYFSHAGKEMLGLADLVIYLDYSTPRLMLHNLKRWLLHRKRPRAELPEGCEEKLPVQVLRALLRGDFMRLHEEAIRTHAPRRFVRVRSPHQARAFIKSLT